MHPASTDAQTGTAFTTQLECKVYDEANVTTSLSDKVGVVKLRQITQNASSLVQEAVTSLVDQGAEALVLDLRDNPGGYLTQAVNISSLFVSSGVLVQITSKDGPQTEKSATGKASFPGIPVVVLVNKYTSAAAEVLTASLQGNNRAEVYGETTRGKASVQVVRELKFGGAVRYTAAYYLTPSGEPIDGVGVSPNTAVAQSESTADTQLLAAESEARSQIASE
jgi:carboxyl-terminal processing protease